MKVICIIWCLMTDGLWAATDAAFGGSCSQTAFQETEVDLPSRASLASIHWQLGLSWIRSPPNDQCHYCSLMFVWAMPPAPPIQYQKSGFVLISCLVVGVVTKMIFSHLWKQYWKVDLLLVGTLDTLPSDLICQRLLPVPTFPPHAWNKWSLKTFRIFYCT